MKVKLCVFALILQLFFYNMASAQRQFKALIVTTTNGWHHESIHNGVIALKELATRNFFDAEVFQDPKSFT
ncbi:MAG: ThuA domain-containing protein, partial [Flavisolibacter sp.]